MEFMDPRNKFYTLNEVGEEYALSKTNNVLENHIEYISKYILIINNENDYDIAKRKRNLSTLFKEPLSFLNNHHN